MRYTKFKKTLRLALYTLCTLGLSNIALAQNAHMPKPPTAWLAGVAKPMAEVPLKTVLDNPSFTTSEPGCDVQSFSISLLPAEGNYYGPYKTTGSKIGINQVNFLREFTNAKVRVFVEDIHIKCKNGDSTTASPIIFKTIP